MMQQQAPLPAGKDPQKEALLCIYDVYSRWIQRFPLACRKGCSACCTQSVSMTSQEGEMIQEHVKREGREKWLRTRLTATKTGSGRMTITTNQFAEACLSHQDVDDDAMGKWDFTPCIFLEDGICSIYEVRPFGCRSFASITQCTREQAAEIAPIHLTVNTIFLQIIEHINSDNGYCSGMADILQGLVNSDMQYRKKHLLPARPVPGFLFEPHERQVVHSLLQQLYRELLAKGITGDLIDNFLPI